VAAPGDGYQTARRAVVKEPDVAGARQIATGGVADQHAVGVVEDKTVFLPVDQEEVPGRHVIHELPWCQRSAERHRCPHLPVDSGGYDSRGPSIAVTQQRHPRRVDLRRLRAQVVNCREDLGLLHGTETPGQRRLVRRSAETTVAASGCARMTSRGRSGRAAQSRRTSDARLRSDGTPDRRDSEAMSDSATAMLLLSTRIGASAADCADRVPARNACNMLRPS
jgi:hypothetical protein